MDMVSTDSIDLISLSLDGLSARQKAISSNIANADTQGYKRIDVNFEDQLEKIIYTNKLKESRRLLNSADETGGESVSQLPLSVNQNQATMEIKDFKPQVAESDLNQPNAKGNTVDAEQEMAMMAKNGMSYDALAMLQSKNFRLLSEVMKS